MSNSSKSPFTHAMILAAGRGERMRPLTDTTPKPLLMAGGKRLIEWQIERLVTAGVQHIVINHAWLGEQFAATLGDGGRYGCTLHYSAETTALETAGGIAKALPLLGTDQAARHTDSVRAEVAKPFIVVSGDIYCDFDYRSLPNDLGAHAAHLVLVPNPDYNPNGDMGMVGSLISPNTAPRLTYANIGVFQPSVFTNLEAGAKLKLFPWLYEQGTISGQLFNGVWHNVGTPAQLAALEQGLEQGLAQ